MSNPYVDRTLIALAKSWEEVTAEDREIVALFVGSVISTKESFLLYFGVAILRFDSSFSNLGDGDPFELVTKALEDFAEGVQTTDLTVWNLTVEFVLGFKENEAFFLWLKDSL